MKVGFHLQLPKNQVCWRIAVNKNVGIVDKIVRLSIAAVLIGMSATGTIGWWGYVVSIIPLVTGLISWCPIYASAGLSTNKK